MYYLPIATIIGLVLSFIIGFSLYKKSASKFDLKIKNYVDRIINKRRTIFFSIVTRLANIETLFVIVGGLLAYYIYTKQYTKGTAIILASSLSMTVSHGLKYVFKRRRPIKSKKLNYSGYSYPSGHSTVGVCLYTVLAYILYISYNLSFAIVIGGYILGFIIAISRVYLSAHWTSDISVGIMLGTLCTLWTIYFFNRDVDILEIFLKNLNFI